MNGFDLGFDSLFGSVWLLGILAGLVLLMAVVTGRSYLWVLSAWMLLWLFDFQSPVTFTWILWIWWLAIIVVSIWALFTSFSSSRTAMRFRTPLMMVLVTVLLFFLVDVFNGTSYGRPVLGPTAETSQENLEEEESPSDDPTTTSEPSESPSETPTETPSASPTAEPTDEGGEEESNEVDERKYYGAPATIPGGTCDGMLGWDTLVECVEDNSLQYYIDGVNSRSEVAGFDWSDIKTWAEARTPEGNLPEVRYIQVFGPDVTHEQAVARGRAVTGEILRVVRQPSCFANTQGIEQGQVADFNYCPRPERQVRVSLLPLRLNADGEAVGVLDSNSGVLIDCLNIWWSRD